MNSGFKIRNRSITVAAALSAIAQTFLDSFIKDFAQKKGISDYYIAIDFFVYIFIFAITSTIIQKLLKSKFVRIHIFKEKIIEGKWFECIYTDAAMTKKYAYGIVDTFFDDNGELVYKGTDYSLEDFREVGEFYSTCTSLKYYTKDYSAVMDYAYNFEYCEKQFKGYGCIKFVVGNRASNRHSGKFFNSDGHNYYFSAVLITDKKILKDLTGGSNTKFKNATKKLIQLYHKDVPSARDRINAIYEMEPEKFDEFRRKEDFNGNLSIEILKNDFKNKVVLDMGCGTGRFSECVIDKVKQLLCSDFSEKMVVYLMNSELYTGNKEKMQIFHCDHFALPVYLDKWKNKVDYIIAGYTIGAYFNDGLTDENSKKHLFSSLVNIFQSILTENGTVIIIESIGLKDKSGKVSLLEHDRDLAIYFQLLNDFGFEKKEIDTSFKFESEEDAVAVVSNFWGADGVERLVKEKGVWYLYETSCVWRKTFTGDSNEEAN